MFFDRRRLKKQARVIFIVLVVVLSAGLIMSSIKWAGTPSKTISRAQQGITQEEMQKYFQEKIDELEKKVKDNPKDAKALSELASLYTITGESKKAIAQYQKIIALQPDNVDARLNLASVYYNNNEIDKAEEQIELAVEKQPENINARMNLATIYFYNNKYDQAEEQVKHVLDKQQNNATAHRLYAYILANGKEDYKAAVKELDKFIELAKEGPLVDKAKEVKKDWQKKIKE
ncbi:cytochrome c-type biogenesis protein CcmH/NrfG [Desulfohalotomaculum tongense]|uniref:tetratricopeptide repeat protein n=1 Tax=Desulforadius tongensis TaxID=1216062 RepID=UPI00195B2A25|nr:tetratricopeptide repeat protein [Desulforadius tongensis]MBM7856090.1 cytochrome c-type biogenesis protein CcmH/NrfG [Desulforadius tongensis]